jgi:hypothetical protein
MMLVRDITETITIKNLFERLEIKDNENESLDIPFPLKVKTPYGFKNIKCAFRTEKQKVVTTYFSNNKTLKTSENHRLFSNNEWKYVKDLKKDDFVNTESGVTKIKRKHIGKKEILYDISVEDVHCYYSNGILSHNSWILSKLGAEAMKMGKNVVHYTLELNQNYVGLRYDSVFSGIDFQDVRKNIPKIEQCVSQIKGKLKIKYFPIKTVSVNGLHAHIQQLTAMEFKPDLMIVDYADILKSITTDKNSNSYSEMGSIYEELRGLAGELQIPVWTASQSNRSGMDNDIIEASSIADSYRKVMTADFVMSLSRKREDKISHTGRFHIIKNRFGADGMTFPSYMNTSCGDIKIFDEKSDEGRELQNKMKGGEQNEKNYMLDTFKKVKQESNKASLG